MKKLYELINEEFLKVIIIIMISFIMIVYFVSNTFFPDIRVISKKESEIIFSMIMITVLIMVTMVTIVNYLNRSRVYYRKASSNRDLDIIREIERLKEKLDQNSNLTNIELAKKNLPKVNWEKITNNILEKAKQVSLEEIANKATLKLSENLTNLRVEQLDQHFNRTYNRLNQEIEELGRRGNLNLAIGIITTVVGFIIFGILVFNISVSSDEFSILKDFLPRLSLVFLIELFAYFFLGLYKSSLTEIKYFQNEITNLETWHLSLQQAMVLDDNDTTKNLLERLSSTERNFLLKKGESTVFLETENLSQNQQKTLIDNLASALIKAKHQEKSS